MFASSTNASAQTVTPLANRTFNNRVTMQSGPLFAVDASFQFVDVRDLGTIGSFLIKVK